MRIFIQYQNTTTGEQVFTASAPDGDSAISEIGRIERIMDKGAKCIHCGEPCDSIGSLCSDNCAEEHTTEHAYKEDDNLHI